MSMDLTSQSGAEMNVNSSGWGFVLNVAEAYGWVPAGTATPADLAGDPWDGSYEANAGQTIGAQDARNLAAALRRAHADPGRRAVESKVAHDCATALRAIMLRDYGIELSADDDGHDRTIDQDFLLELASFCDGGEIAIW